MSKTNTATERAHRYSLILETVNDEHYYFDTNLGTFVKMYDKDKPKKSALKALDFLTSNFSSKESIAKTYGIEEEIKKAYITYEFKGEKRLKVVFDNKVWSEIAYKTNGREIDYRHQENLQAFNDVYYEICDLDSDFANTLLKNEKHLINLSNKTRETIRGLVAHEKAIKMKHTYGFDTDYNRGAYDVYSEDRYGFYEDLKKRLSPYREFRTVYLNYCRYKRLDEQKRNTQEPKPKKKVIIPPYQTSLFDNE